MSFSVQRHKNDQRLGKFSKSALALVDMIAEQDWERVIILADGIAQDARVEIIQASMDNAGEKGIKKRYEQKER